MNMSPATSEETLDLDGIVPYWRNPRRITDEAVNAVAASISEYGYQQPIVVDAANVIVIGHTRYAALRRLGARQAKVLRVTGLDQAKVKQLRVMDNRVREFTSWDYEALVAELSGLDTDLMRSFFPEAAMLTDDGPPDPPPPPSPSDPSPVQDPVADFVCPSCFHGWSMPVTVEAIRTGHLGPPSATPPAIPPVTPSSTADSTTDTVSSAVGA
jgi:hypothetical protein